MFAVLDLTFYEVGNVLWKEYRKGRIRDLLMIATLFPETLTGMNIKEVRSKLVEVTKLALKENLTFYDASYLYVAKKHSVKLVTEDKDLKKFPESIDTRELLKELDERNKAE